uniref:Reverse transcriptase domain-containing protein n=1 Tax=Tanacetum cinerariifolium TaxID=118510 RepID=A0A6L2MBD1_TANCI|nr:reverse transcriptase domain-containing protein [Tanacetum cinerariifolium]
MRTRSSSNRPVVSLNLSTSNPKRRNRRRSKQPFILEESLVDTMADQRTMAKFLRAPTEGYAEEIVVPPILTKQFELKHSLINMMTSDQITNLRNEISDFQQRFDESFHEAYERYKDLLRACPHHGLTELHQLDTFYNALNPTDQDSLNSAACGNLLERRTQDALTIIKSKSTFQATPTPASIKAVEEIFVTYDGAHPYYQCLAAGGNTFPELRDNIQGYVAVAAVNYNQGSSIYHPPGSGSLPSNTIANPKGELKAITTRSGACINLMPLSVWKKLGLTELISTRVTLKLANRAICTPAGIARDVFVSVGKFVFLADFVIVDNESDPKVPLILGRPFLRTARALIDVYGEEMILHLDSIEDLHPPHHVNPLSGSTTYSYSPSYLLEEFADELALITFPPKYDDDLQFDIESYLKEIEYLLYHDPIKDIDSILMDSIDQYNLTDLNDNFVDSMPEMFTDEHAFDYSSPLLFDEYDDDLFEVESDTEMFMMILLTLRERKSKKDFSRVDALPSTNNEEKVFNPSILIQENPFEIITRVVQDKKLAISHASLIIEDFNPPLYELPFFKEVSRSKILLPFSSKNEEKVFKPGIHTSEKVHSFLIKELSRQGYKVFKINQIFKSLMKIFLFSCGKDIGILDVPCLHFYPLDQFKYGGIGSS